MKDFLNVSLVPFKRKHISLTFKWIKNPMFRNLFMMRGEVCWEAHKKHFKEMLADSSQRVYAILSNNRHVGNCGLKNFSLLKKVGELWLYIGEPLMRRKGIGKKAAQLLIKQAFEVFGLKLVYLHFAEFNIAAHKLYKKLGFRKSPLNKNDHEWLNSESKVIRMELRKKI